MSELTERVQGEFENFRRAVIINCSSAGVFDKSYEICWKTEIYQAVVDTEYTEEQEIGLLNCRGNLLNILYEEWMHYSYDGVDELRQMIERFANKLYEEGKKNEI